MLDELSAKDLDTQALVAKKATYMNRVLNYSLKSSLATNLEYESEVTNLQRHVAIREEALDRLQKQIGHADEKFANELVAVDQTILPQTAAEQCTKVLERMRKHNRIVRQKEQALKQQDKTRAKK